MENRIYSRKKMVKILLNTIFAVFIFIEYTFRNKFGIKRIGIFINYHQPCLKNTLSQRVNIIV
jgi:hypothetical protein